MNVKLLATENILVFRLEYKYKMTFLSQSIGDLSVESKWCLYWRYQAKASAPSPHCVMCTWKKKGLFTDIGTQRRAPNLVNRILRLFGQQGSG